MIIVIITIIKKGGFMLKHSKQRDAIFLFLADRKDHPTAETIYLEMKKDYPNISLGTVYRNLNLLSQQNEIQKIISDGGPDRFDPNTKIHPHFFCTQCHCVLDLKMDEPDMTPLAQKEFLGTITGQKTYFLGLCPECKNNTRKGD